MIIIESSDQPISALGALEAPAIPLDCRLVIFRLKRRIERSNRYDKAAEHRRASRAKLSIYRRPMDASYWMRERDRIGYIDKTTRLNLSINIEAWEAEIKQISRGLVKEQEAHFSALSAKVADELRELNLK